MDLIGRPDTEYGRRSQRVKFRTLSHVSSRKLSKLKSKMIHTEYNFLLIDISKDFDLPSSDNMTVEQRVELYHRYIEVCKFAFGIRAALGDTWSERVKQVY